MKIAVIADIHYSAMNGESLQIRRKRDLFFHELLECFFHAKADYFVSLGDLTHGGSDEEYDFFRGEIKERKLGDAFVQILGNHDLVHATKQEVLARTGQSRYHMVDTPEARLLFLDTCLETIPDGYMDEEQLVWLDRMVRSTGSKPLLVFAHHPVYATTIRSTEEEGRHAIGPDIQIQSVLEQHEGDGLYVNGHLHVNSIVRSRQWSYIQTASALNAPGYRIIEIDEGAIQIDYIQLHHESLKWNRAVAEHTKSFVFRSDVLGNDSDKRHVIPRGNESKVL